MNSEQRLNHIKEQIEAAKIQRAKLSHEIDTAQAATQKLVQNLVDNFGVSTVEEAKTLLLTMNTELSQLLADLENQLETLRNDS